MVVDCIKPSQVEKMQDLSEAKIQISDRVQTDSIVKKGRSSPSNDDKNSNDENKGTAKKLKRSKAVSTVEKHSSLSAKRLTINTSDRFEGGMSLLKFAAIKLLLSFNFYKLYC